MFKSKINKLDSMLKQALGNDVQVLDEISEFLTEPGEHYGSIMLALKVKIKCESNNKTEVLDLVAKMLPANEMLRIAFDIAVTFKKEIRSYKEAIPALVSFQKEYGIPESRLYDKLFPKCYGARLSIDEYQESVDKDAILIFENLTSQGFITEDRLVGFDYSATKVILQDLARFHAVPIALRILRPQIFKETILPTTVPNKGLERLPQEVGQAFQNAIWEGVRACPDLEPYLDRLQKVMDARRIYSWEDCPFPDNPFVTRCHADFWVSNTMIRKDNFGRTVENRIVDLQLTRYGSCATDLVFFLFTSVINIILEENYIEFLRIYHEAFLDTLAEFEIDLVPFSWESFLEEVRRVGPREAYHILIMLKPICTERGKITNSLEEFQDTDWSRKDLLGPNHRRKLHDTVLALVDMGWM